MKKYSKYLFFDIESCNGRPHKATICSFGYYLTDLNFNLIERGDILINPPFRFESRLLKNYFHYKEHDFRNAPSFNIVYNHIKNLFREDTLAIGFELKNDIKYLDSAFKHYHLKKLSYDFFDVKFLYSIENKSLTLNKGLKKCMEDLNINLDDFHFHRSDDDAQMTMIVCKNFLEKYNTTLEKFLLKYNIEPGRYEESETKDVQLYDSYKIYSDFLLSTRLINRVMTNYISDLNKSLGKANLSVREPVYLCTKMMSKDLPIFLSTIEYIYSNNQYIIDAICSVKKIYDFKGKLNKTMSVSTRSTLNKNHKFINVDDIDEIINNKLDDNKLTDYFEFEINRSLNDFIKEEYTDNEIKKSE